MPCFFGDGQNARLMRLLMEHEQLAPIDTADPEQVRQRVTEYFEFCLKHDLIPQIIGLANWIGVSRDTVNSWKRGEFPGRKEHRRIVETAYSIIEEILVSRLMDDKIPAPTGIFMLKAMFGYVDRVEVTFGPRPDPMGGLDADEARERLASALQAEDRPGGGGGHD